MNNLSSTPFKVGDIVRKRFKDSYEMRVTQVDDRTLKGIVTKRGRVFERNCPAHHEVGHHAGTGKEDFVLVMSPSELAAQELAAAVEADKAAREAARKASAALTEARKKAQNVIDIPVGSVWKWGSYRVVIRGSDDQAVWWGYAPGQVRSRTFLGQLSLRADFLTDAKQVND